MGKMNIRLSRNFVLSEFNCPCGNCQTTVEDISMNLIYKLQQLRDKFKLPIKIASGYRCREHNLAIGGAPKSQHMQGKAVDIDTKHLSAHDKHRLIQFIFSLGAFGGVGIGAGKIHIDVRTTDKPVFWFYW